MCFIKVEWHIHHMKTAAGLKEKQIIKAVSHTKAFARDQLMAFKCFPRVFVHVILQTFLYVYNICTVYIEKHCMVSKTAFTFPLGFVWKADANCHIRKCSSSLSPWCCVTTVSPWGLRGQWWWGHIPMSLLWEMADINPLICNRHKHTHRYKYTWTGTQSNNKHVYGPREKSVCLSSVAVNNSLFPCDITSLSR